VKIKVFDIFNKKDDEKVLKDSENRQHNFNRERDTFRSAGDDQFHAVQQDVKSDLIRWQQEFSEELLSFKNTLRGLAVMDGELVRVSAPICNELFINIVDSQLKPFLNKNFFNSNIDEKRLLMMLEQTSNDLVDLMADKSREFEISFSDFDIILRGIKNVIVPAAYRSLKGWTKKIDSTMIKRIESTSEATMSQPNRKGLMGVFG